MGDFLSADKIGQFSKEICLELNVITCCCTSSFLIANVDFLESWVADKKSINPVGANNMKT